MARIVDGSAMGLRHCRINAFSLSLLTHVILDAGLRFAPYTVCAGLASSSVKGVPVYPGNMIDFLSHHDVFLYYRVCTMEQRMLAAFTLPHNKLRFEPLTRVHLRVFRYRPITRAPSIGA